VVENLAASRQLLSDALDTYRGSVAERQTNATVLLSVYAAVLLPVSFIAGWYGMNTASLPGADSPHGWVVVTALMVAVGLGTLAVFWRAGLVRTSGGRSKKPPSPGPSAKDT